MAASHYSQKWVKLNHPEFRTTPGNPSYVPKGYPDFAVASQVSAPRNAAPGYDGVGVNSPGPKFNYGPSASAKEDGKVEETFQPPMTPTFNVNSGSAQLQSRGLPSPNWARIIDSLRSTPPTTGMSVYRNPTYRAETSSAVARRLTFTNASAMFARSDEVGPVMQNLRVRDAYWGQTKIKQTRGAEFIRRTSGLRRTRSKTI